MTDAELTKAVRDELAFDPRVDAGAIAVSADNGLVTLRGTTHTLREKIEAKRAAKRVHGVVDIDDQLKARILNSRDDNEIRGAILQAFALDSFVPSTIDATVTDGFVTLSGTAAWQFQRDEADSVASNVAGVVAVEDSVTLVIPPVSRPDVKEAISDAFSRSARLDADDLTVQSTGGTVTISGTVNSWSEHDEAVDAAWAVPGVSDVRDLIVVAY